MNAGGLYPILPHNLLISDCYLLCPFTLIVKNVNYTVHEMYNLSTTFLFISILFTKMAVGSTHCATSRTKHAFTKCAPFTDSPERLVTTHFNFNCMLKNTI